MAKKKKQKITFRRIRGRIVPIKVKDSTTQKATGISIAALGAAVGLGAGVAQRKAKKTASRFRVASFRARGLAERALTQPGRGQLDFFSSEAGKVRSARLLGRAKKLRTRAKAITKFGINVRSLGIGLGGSFLATGIEQALDKPLKTKDISKEVVKDFSINLAAIGATAAFVLGRGKIRGARIKKLTKCFKVKKK